MAIKKYVTLSALSNFLDNLKNIFASEAHTHTQSEITDLVIDNEVSASSNLVRNSAVNAAINSTKEELSQNIEAVKEYTDTEIANLVNSAPETLDTLGELAKALQDNTEVVDVLNEAIGSKANKTDIVQADWNQSDDTALDYVKNRTHWVEDDGETYHPLDEKFIPDTIATKDYVEALYMKLNSNTVLGFYCIEDVTIVINGISKVYPANSNVEVTFIEDDVFEIIPTSNNSILQLNAFPGALGTFYPWLEGVKQFSNILFDMNDVNMYSKWSQGNQGSYQVQYAQYLNCIFWSDNPYVSDVAKRTNYTLYYTSQLPLCYSTIPDNTFKAFYLAFNVNSDPNWGNKVYRDSFAKATWATQVFSYYGARTIGIFGHDDPDFNIILPKDCRGLMSAATAIENAGTFDAINVTNFGAKSGSWRDAFGWCSSLRNLYIKNLKVNLNVSWSPLEYDSIYFIISTAANTNNITISVSPYTYNLLAPSDFELAASKNITIELLTTNYVEDRRLSAIANKADKDEVLLKTEQTLTEEELTQIRKNLKFIGKDVEGQVFTIDGTEYTASPNAEIFGDYDTNIAVGQWSIAEGSGTVAKGRVAHAEGAFTQALNDGCHTEGYQTIATGYWSHAEGEMTRVTSYASHAEGSYTKMPDGSTRYGTASGYASHIEGGGCYAQGSCSHSEGLATTTKGNYSHSEGRYTIAGSAAQHVEGTANIEDTEGKYIHIAGNGSFEERSNAHTLDWQGNAEFAGDVVAHGCSSSETPVSLIEVNSLAKSLQEAMSGIEDITSEEIQALFA
ncbi:MAG: hypothetical protein J6R59_09775 [Paludibacteraceae bacterium]|nr:hypothetical protein [Paludibacteraceae bacterium]